jgi:hypothetical protein
VAPRKHSAINLRDEGLDPQCHHYYPRLIRACASYQHRLLAPSASDCPLRITIRSV